jgi:hypothetical protein
VVSDHYRAAQTVYRHAVDLYGKIHAQFNPSPVIVPTVEMALAATDEKAIAVMVEEIQVERYFIAQFDQIDSVDRKLLTLDPLTLRCTHKSA